MGRESPDLSTRSLTEKQKAQDAAYDFPYHYVPAWSDRFTQIRYLSWGYRYAGEIQVVLDLLGKFEFESLIDVGCGDGRFLREVAKVFPHCNVLGIDHTEKPVRLAKALNPDLPFEVMNVAETTIREVFDVATALEVLEHIPPEAVNDFLDGIFRLLKPGGFLIVTVPHVNDRLLSKHYRHFDSDRLREVLGRSFKVISMIPMDADTIRLRILKNLCLGISRFYVVTFRKWNDFFFQYYMKKAVYAPDEVGCRKLAAVCRKVRTD